MKNNNKRPLLGIGNFLLKRLRWNVFNLPKTRSSARFIVHQWGATVEQSVNPSKLTEVVFHLKCPLRSIIHCPWHPVWPLLMYSIQVCLQTINASSYCRCFFAM